MPTTTKMGIVYPASTDLVKDGATAMGTISTTVDSKTGLILLNTTNFTSVSSQSINNMFSSSFTNYRILIEATGSTTTNLVIRMRLSGTDNSTTNYNRELVRLTDSTTAFSYLNEDFGFLGNLTTNRSIHVIDIFNPNNSVPTNILCNFHGDSGTYNVAGLSYIRHNVSTAYDGFTIYPSSGTFTGIVSIYGYNK